MTGARSLLVSWTVRCLPIFALLTFRGSAVVEAFVRPSSMSTSRGSFFPESSRRTRKGLVHLAPTDLDVHALTEALHSSLLHNSQSWIASLPNPPSWLTSSWQLYCRFLQEEPVRTKATTAAVLCSLGDGVAQWRSDEKSYSFRRGLAFLLFGALYTGAFQHHWFQFMQQHVAEWGENLHIWGHPAETNIPVQFFIEQRPEWWQYFDMSHEINLIMDTLQDPPSNLELAVAKVALNQFLIIPFVYMPLFFLVTGAIAGLDWNQIVARARSLYVSILKRNYLFWLPIQTFQFAVVPPDYQVPFVCVASLCWTILLSSIGGSSTPSASPSSIVAYYQEDAAPLEGEVVAAPGGEPIIRVQPVAAGAANDITDDVLWEDVRDTFVPKDVRDAVGDVQEALTNNPQVGGGAGGLALGLLASAADEAAIGATLGAALGASENLGIAVFAAVGAGAGYLVSQAINTDSSKTSADDSATNSGMEKVDDEMVPTMFDDAGGHNKQSSTDIPISTTHDGEKHQGRVPTHKPIELQSAAMNQSAGREE